MTQYIYGYSNDTKNVYEKLMSIIQEHVLQECQVELQEIANYH